MIIVYVLIAIIAFGFMIFIHELGHFVFAKKFGVTISEFSLGMGPKLFSHKGKDGVNYSLRLFPIGGFVSMVGEEEESDDPNAFNNKSAWKRFIIVCAGAVMNILVAIVIMFILTSTQKLYGTTIIADFKDGALSENSGLCVNDKIIKVENTRVHTYSELSYEILRKGYEPIKITVIRDGNKMTIDNVVFPSQSSQGIVFGNPDFYIYGEERSFTTLVKNSFYSSKSTVKMIWDSLIDLITGRYGIEQVSGPVGVTGAITDAAKTGAYTLFYIIAVISMNLGIFNLLPIPALDGGTLLLIIAEMITKKRIPKNIEAGIKTVGFLLLMLIAVTVTFKDVIYLFK